MGRLVLYGFLFFVGWLVKRDIVRRGKGVSGAIWIPTIWVGILASRPVSAWLGFGGATDSLEGSPLDRLFYFGFIASAFIVLAKRRFNWPEAVARDWPIFLFYGYLLISVLWADSPSVSFKRWFKDFGNIPIVYVILTELNPAQAFRAVFIRCAFLLLPLSYILIRWFPDLGRRYSNHSGAMEAVGVTFQKNSLGAMAVVCGLVLVWDWLERTENSRHLPFNRIERYLPLLLLGIAVYLLHLADSKTSIVILALSAAVLFSSRIPLLRNRIGALGAYAFAAAIGGAIIDYIFGIKEAIVTSLGRDMTFTGRTDVWRELLALNTDPLIGTGFLSFWSDYSYQSRLPEWVAFSAHNGYLETYIDGGMIGVFFLVVMLIGVLIKINSHLKAEGSYSLIRFAVFIATIIGNFSESHFTRMTPLWFLFLLVAIEPLRTESALAEDREDTPERNDDLETEGAYKS